MGFNVTNNERYTFQLIKRIENSPYEWEDNVSCSFKGRPANQYERKQFRIQQGVNGSTDSIYVLCSNLPDNVKPKDKIIYLGKEWTVNSIGYYFDAARFINPSHFTEEYIAKKCPKGMNLE